MSSSSSNKVVVRGSSSEVVVGGGTTAATVVPPPSPTTIKVDVVVSQDPTTPGACRTINDALMRAPADASVRFGIHVMAGTYPEYVTIKRSNVTLVGDGIGKTTVTGSRSVQGGFSTYNSATLIVEGDGFIGAGITVQNTAGPGNDQAVAMRCNSVHAAFYRCSFEGYQDTLYAYSGIQFYKECQIYGTVDFIFSRRAAAVLQNCKIYARIPGDPGKSNTITADGRAGPNDPWGICIHNCEVLASPELSDALAKGAAIKTYLGRPWGACSRTAFMTTKMDGLVDGAGWSEWPKAPATRKDTVYYAEYHNCGRGAAINNWKGYHLIVNDNLGEASQFTVAKFIDGNSWLPQTGVPFSPGLDEPGQSPCPPPATPPTI